MEVKFIDWKNRMTQWAEKISASSQLIKNASIGYMFDYFTIEIKYETHKTNIVLISQTATGTDIDIELSYLKFEHYNPEFINFDLSVYQKDFFERILNLNKIKTGNKIFDSKFGISCSEKTVATNLFNDVRVQSFFLNNSFLVFNVQRKTSMVTLRNMEVKIYKKAELQELLDKFVHILELIHKSNP
jgi:hypothetical protein